MRVWKAAAQPVLAILPGMGLAMLVMLRSGLKRTMNAEGGEAPPAKRSKKEQ